jgi:hypothetical protein
MTKRLEGFLSGTEGNHDCAEQTKMKKDESYS